MEKEKYSEPEFEILLLEKDDIVKASGTGDWEPPPVNPGTDDEGGGWGEI